MEEGGRLQALYLELFVLPVPGAPGQAGRRQVWVIRAGLPGWLGPARPAQAEETPHVLRVGFQGPLVLGAHAFQQGQRDLAA